jgi:hypothetical protein
LGDDGAESIIARTVKKGGTTVTLRNERGVRLWSGRRKRKCSLQPYLSNPRKTEPVAAWNPECSSRIGAARGSAALCAFDRLH